jgi:hypothetical protein
MVVGTSGNAHTPRALASTQLTNLQKRLLSGFASAELLPSATKQPTDNLNYFPGHPSDQCGGSRLGQNLKVNQNCLNVTDPNLQGRGQANNETAAAIDPTNGRHILMSANDYRRGDGNCYGDYSLNGGVSFADTTIPMGFTRGATFGGVPREYWQAGGDTSVAWDTKGNAYFDCMVFMRGPTVTNNPDQSSAVYMFRSTQNNGASWNFPGRPVVEQYDTTGTILLDKPYMTVDNHVGSPFQDRVYVTWTLFNALGQALIYEAYSSDYGQTFSAPVLVSGTSPLCTASVVSGCDANQFSDPFTGSDGNLYVVYANFNNSLSSATDNHNQFLLSKSIDGGVTFSPPVLVANYNDLPDCDTYQGDTQDPFRSCVPEKGSGTLSVFRATNYPSGGVNPTDPSQIVVTFGSYINKYSNPSNGCIPAGFAANGNNLFTGVKTAGACNNKILVSVSSNAGTTFAGTITDPTTLPVVNQAPGQKLTDQWWQWQAFTSTGKLAVSYYDRQYGNDETSANMDFSLSGSSNLSTFGTTRATSSSMPPPTQFPNSLGHSVFFGDYTGLATDRVGNTAWPVWMDTRSPDVFICPGTGVTGVAPVLCEATNADGTLLNDQDIFTQHTTIP